MMAGLFLLFVAVVVLIWMEKKTASIVLTLVTLALCLLMFLRFITVNIPISL